MAPELLLAHVLQVAEAFPHDHVLWQAFSLMMRHSLGLVDMSRELTSRYSNLVDYMSTLRYHGGAKVVHLLNGFGGTGLGRATAITDPYAFFKARNFTAISLRTISARGEAPELKGGISIPLRLRLLDRFAVSRSGKEYGACSVLHV